MSICKDSLILTDGGYAPIGSLVNMPVNLVDANSKICATKIISGGIQEVVRLTFSDDSMLECNRNQIFITSDGTNAYATDMINKQLKKYSNDRPNLVCTKVEITTAKEELFTFNSNTIQYGIVNNSMIHY